MSETKEFKTESKRLLDLMINSIYTNREIFLRELISNASDANDKYHYLSLNDEKLPKIDNQQIHITLNKSERSIEIVDNGIGMTHDELVNNLGTIASSGSAEFIKKMKESENDKNKEVDIIGQFGVGFYSAFMVAKNVVVETKSPFDEKGYRFISTGEDTYTIDEIDKKENGSSIKVFLRDNKDEDSYDEFLETYKIEELVKKYSDYIRYPIKMLVEESEPELDSEGKAIEGKYKTVNKEKVLNSMIPLWKKNKNEVSKEELNEFYKNKFYDYQDPLHSAFFSVEGLISFESLIFIPTKAPYDLYSNKYEKGLQLYTKGVLIMDKCKDLLPDYLKFVKGIVDSQDLSLNISREMLQQNAELRKIATTLEKKILGELENLKKNDFDKYKLFFKEYGANLKYGAYDGFGAKKDLLKDLFIYESINADDMITLKQYVESMKADQKVIYYAAGKDKEAALSLPQMDMIKKKGYDCLLLTEDVDEFVLMVLQKYMDKEFKNITDESIDELSEEEKNEIEQKAKDNKPLLDSLKECLKGKVDDVKLSTRLVDSPVCLVNKDGVSFEMEKVLEKNAMAEAPKAIKVLEINPNHELLKAINKIYENNPSDLATYAEVLYNQAMLIEGLEIKDPTGFSKLMVDLIIKSAK